MDERDVTDVSYWMVWEYVATRRREIHIEAGRELASTFISREAEVDFGEVAVRHSSRNDDPHEGAAP